MTCCLHKSANGWTYSCMVEDLNQQPASLHEKQRDAAEGAVWEAIISDMVADETMFKLVKIRIIFCETLPVYTVKVESFAGQIFRYFSKIGV